MSLIRSHLPDPALFDPVRFPGEAEGEPWPPPAFTFCSPLLRDPGTNVVQVHVARLRAELDPPGPTPMPCTDRGLGYRLSPA